ncbi:hypothetical protein [Nonomuraea fuscirosea]|uniref:hypothetical protein n=1 Tax=Nonomuraea fuscirosea TaxID=1291556 RepID=UPI00344A6424
MSSPDGRLQFSFSINGTWYQRLNDSGGIEPHPIDEALRRLTVVAMCADGHP